jgi:hypothetical protein
VQSAEQLRGDLVEDARRGFLVASPKRALRDLKRVRRNLDLVADPDTLAVPEPDDAHAN